MWRAATFVVAVLALGLALPAVAAARVVAPPGNSEADQYYETLPASTGQHAPNSNKDEADAVAEGHLSPATAGALRRRGAAGQALATTVAKTAPAAGGPGGGQAVAGESAAQAGPTGDGGLGAVFPLLLVGIAAGAAGFALARWRRPVAR